MSLKASFQLRVSVLFIAVAWKVWLVLALMTEGTKIGPAVFLFLVGLLPYVALAVPVGCRLERSVFLTAAFVMGMLDAVSGFGAIWPGTSTDPVALLTQPLISLAVVIPVTWLVGCVRRNKSDSCQ